MAAPKSQDRTGIQFSNYEHALEMKAVWAAQAYERLDQFNPGPGPMPNIVYVIPDGSGDDIQYIAGAGELYFHGNLYSSLGWDQKIKFFQYLDKFIAYATREYSHTYNI